jgi:hypothetical protein
MAQYGFGGVAESCLFSGGQRKTRQFQSRAATQAGVLQNQDFLVWFAFLNCAATATLIECDHKESRVCPVLHIIATDKCPTLKLSPLVNIDLQRY